MPARLTNPVQPLPRAKLFTRKLLSVARRTTARLPSPMLAAAGWDVAIPPRFSNGAQTSGPAALVVQVCRGLPSAPRTKASMRRGAQAAADGDDPSSPPTRCQADQPTPDAKER